MGTKEDNAYFGRPISSVNFPLPPEIHTPVGNMVERLCVSYKSSPISVSWAEALITYH